LIRRNKYANMKNVFNALRIFISIIALLLFASGVVLTLLGVYDFGKALIDQDYGDLHHLPRSMAIGLLKAVDLFLIAIVFFVFSLGILVLFHNAETPLPIKLPEWLRIKNFMQLKVILWEAILTTLVISYLASLAEIRMDGHEITKMQLIVPAAILMISVSLFFLKKGEKEEPENH
jgi:uncharacterized membrane protein YqhA